MILLSTFYGFYVTYPNIDTTHRVQTFFFLQKRKRVFLGLSIDPNGNVMDPNSQNAHVSYQIDAIIETQITPYIIRLIKRAQKMRANALDNIQKV